MSAKAWDRRRGGKRMRIILHHWRRVDWGAVDAKMRKEWPW